MKLLWPARRYKLTHRPWRMLLKYIPRDKDVYIHCYSGQTAGQAVVLLNIAGVSAKGGMGTGTNAPLGWANKEYPVVASN